MSAAPAYGVDTANQAAADQLASENGQDVELGGNNFAQQSNKLSYTEPESTAAVHPQDSLLRRIWKHLDGEVDPAQCTYQLLAYCFITGWVDAVSFAAAFLFSGFQTGNVVQLAAAIARIFSGPDRTTYFHPADRLALTSLCSFVLGSLLGGQLGDRLGPKKRWWLIGVTFAQTGAMFIGFLADIISDASSIAPDRGDIPWDNALGFVTIAFISGSMGLQAIAAKRLNTHYGTTVVLTTIWTELAADPGLLKPRLVASRDHRAAAVFMLLLGALISRIIINYIGGAASLGIGTAIRLVVAFSFWTVPSKIVKKV